MSVVEAVQRDLDRMRPEVAGSAWAASALVLAAQLDDPATSATSKSMCAKALGEAMDRLGELSPPERKTDGIDDLAAAREERLERARRSGAAHLDGAGGV